MKKKWLLIGLISIFVFSGSLLSPAVACDKGKDCKFGKPSDFSGKSLVGNSLPCPCFLLKKSGELKLTEKQQADLKAIKLEMKKGKIANYAQVKILKLELQNALEQDPIDTEKADLYVDQIARYLATTAKDCIVARIQARRVLTDAQFRQAKKLAERCAQKHGWTGQKICDKTAGTAAFKVCSAKGTCKKHPFCCGKHQGCRSFGQCCNKAARKAGCGQEKKIKCESKGKADSSLFLQPGDLGDL